jgi:O-acetylserine/cysteine efflux transporter
MSGRDEPISQSFEGAAGEGTEAVAARRLSLSPIDLLAVLAAVAIWGTNFAVIPIALAKLPPLLLAALRFAFSAVPGVFFLKRPRVSWRNIGAYGVLSGLGQFGLLYIAMGRDITPGLASLVIQMQVFFTVAMAAVVLREPVRAFQVLAMGLAACGLAVIAHFGHGSATPLGLILTLLAALSWALANMTMKAAGAVNMLAYVAWASLFAVPPLLACSLLFEGPARIVGGLEHATLAVWLTVLWQALGNSVFAFAVWGSLLHRYPAATVTPFALLVPVFGLGASALFLREPLQPWKLLAGLLLILGLAINILWPLAWGAASRRFGWRN